MCTIALFCLCFDDFAKIVALDLFVSLLIFFLVIFLSFVAQENDLLTKLVLMF